MQLVPRWDGGKQLSLMDIFLPSLFESVEHIPLFWPLMEDPDVEIIVDGEVAFFSWNNEVIQELAEELGETDFPESRPCG